MTTRRSFFLWVFNNDVRFSSRILILSLGARVLTRSNLIRSLYFGFALDFFLCAPPTPGPRKKDVPRQKVNRVCLKYGRIDCRQ
jgi:hypothetical protein